MGIGVWRGLVGRGGLTRGFWVVCGVVWWQLFLAGMRLGSWVERAEWIVAAGTLAGPSAPLRFAQDDKSEAARWKGNCNRNRNCNGNCNFKGKDNYRGPSLRSG